MTISPPKKNNLKLPKNKWILAAWCVLALAIPALLLRIGIPLLWPEDHYLVQEVIDPTTYIPYAHVYEPLNVNDQAQLEVLGYSPLPGYVPEGFSLDKAELITDEDASIVVDARAVKLTYVSQTNRKKQFYLLASAGERLDIEFEQEVLNYPVAFSNQGNSVWATFADTDVIIYHNKMLKQYFCRFSAGGHEWLLNCTGMTKRDVRLIITAILQQ